MSDFVKHESCPNCGSRDNLAAYTDGHKWCFGCGHYISSGVTNLVTIQDKLNNNNKEVFDGNSVSLPIDTTTIIPNEALTWLKQYDITIEEIYLNKLLWSSSNEMLIFPKYEDGRLIFWQGRYFPKRKKKNFTCGYPNNHLAIHATKKPFDFLVLVEDPVSEIKVARVADTLCLFGSALNIKRVARIAKLYRRIIIWLDFDKAKEAMGFCNSFRSIINTSMVLTGKDPKEYSTEEIKRILNV